MEYAGEGSQAPLVSIRDGRFKFNHCELDPPQLFDLEADPLELSNLAAEPAQAERVKGFMARVRARWDLARFDAEVRQSQARRSEEHTSELQSLMRNSYAVFCLKKKQHNIQHNN